MSILKAIWVLAAAATLAACGGSPVSTSPQQETQQQPTVVPPTVTLSASPTTVSSGQTTTLTWSSTGATSCAAAGGWSSSTATSGSQVSAALTSDTTFSLVCSGTGGTSTTVTVDVSVTASASPGPIPTAVVSANPTTVASGAVSTLTWSSTDATACAASATPANGAWSGALPSSGSQSTGALTVDTTFSLTCSGAGGTSAAATTTVAVTPVVPVTPGSPVPTVTLIANPPSVASGASSTLSWTSTNATACAASGGWSGAQTVSGSQSTGALTVTTAYSLSCTGPGGTGTATTSVAFNPAPTVTLSAAPTAVASGAASTLTWSSTNATACTATGGWTGALAATGSQSTGALTANTSFSLTCTGAGGTSAAATAQVNVVPTATLTANPTSVASGAASTLTWSSANATSCTASGSWSGALATSGSRSTGPVATNSSFSLTCAGTGGTSATATVQVNVVPTAVLTANPSVVVSGNASTLTWTSTNATGCTASGGWTGALAPNGSQSTGNLTAASTSYSLACTGLGGTSVVATATVTVSSGSVTVSPTNAAIVLTQTQQFTATNPSGGTTSWTVDGVAGGNASVGTVSATGLYTAGTSPSRHTVVATSDVDTTQSGSSTVAVTDLAGVYTYHNNKARDGTNTKEYALTKANVNTATFGKVAACPVDGAIYGQPLWASNVTVGGVNHNMVIVATEHDGLFAFDADASPCSLLWSVNLIDNAHGGTTGETSVPWNLVGVGAGDMQPEVGVTGTPVIDPATGIVYVVSKSISSDHSTFYQRIHAVDITTGNEKNGSPTLIAGTYPGTGDGSTTVTFDPHQELQRAGLALLNGVVYVAFTAHEDNAPWYGWMMSYQYNGTGFNRLNVFNVSPNLKKGGIWMSGGAPAMDAADNIYVITGNGDFNVTSPNNDYGDSLLQLSPTLGLSSYFTPPNEAYYNNNDLDFGSGGAAILADLPAGNVVTHALICGGKDNTIFVMNRDALGGFSNSGVVQTINNGYSIFATGAFWNNSFYIGGFNGPVKKYQLDTTTAQLSVASSSGHHFGFAGATPSISAMGTQNGIVWSLDTGAYCTHQTRGGCGPAVLYAHDASNVATELWNSSTVASDAAGYAVKFTLPTVANGRVYVPTRGNNAGGAAGSTSSNGELSIYGLKP